MIKRRNESLAIFRICIAFVFFILTFFLSAQSAQAKGEPVKIERDTLFSFYANQGLFSAKERAAIVTKRIINIINLDDFTPDSLTLKNDTANSLIFYKHELILALTDQDAKLSELSRPQLAAAYLAILKKRLTGAYENNSFKQIIINVMEAVAVLGLLVLLIWVVNRGHRWARFKLLSSWESRLARLEQRGAPVTYTNRLLPFFVNLLRIGRVVFIILLIYIALPLAFLIIPWTKPIADQLLGYIITPVKDILLAILHYIPNLLTVIVIYLATHYLVKLFKFIAGEVESGAITLGNFYPEWASPTFNIIRVLLYAFMFVVIFPYLPGSGSDVFKGVTVFVGVLFSFGSSSAISNMVAGIVLTYMRPFKIGDRVKLGEVTGDVIEKNLLVTRIRTIKNEDVTVPNSTILGGAVINYSSSSKTLGLILHATITIGYDAEWKTIHDLMISAALATDGILKTPQPFVLQTNLNDFNVSYQINAYTDRSHQMAVLYSNLNQNIQDKFNEAGVEIMSPHYTALRDGNSIQIPDNYKPGDYKKPAFTVTAEGK